MDHRWEIWMEVWSEIFGWIPVGASSRNFAWKLRNSIPLGPSEGVLLTKWEGEVIGEADGVNLGASVKGV